MLLPFHRIPLDERLTLFIFFYENIKFVLFNERNSFAFGERKASNEAAIGVKYVKQFPSLFVPLISLSIEPTISVADKFIK